MTPHGPRFDPRTDPRIAYDAGVQTERLANEVESLSDIRFHLGGIHQKLGALEADVRGMMFRIVVITSITTAITSVVVSGLTAYAVVSWMLQ